MFFNNYLKRERINEKIIVQILEEFLNISNEQVYLISLYLLLEIFIFFF